jgi:diacylglycerol kinase (ATP)
MAYQNAKGLMRIINAFGYSIKGLQACYQLEEAFRQEVLLLIVGVPLSLWLGETPIEKALLLGSLMIIPIVELLNSAIEANVDRVGFERHELSKRAKDIASAAVFMSIVTTFSLWLLILLPKWL